MTMRKNQKSGKAPTRPRARRRRARKWSAFRTRSVAVRAKRARGCTVGVVQSSAGLEVDDDRRKSLGEKGWARRAVVVRSVEPSGAAVFEAVPGREEYDSKEGLLGSRLGATLWADAETFADSSACTLLSVRYPRYRVLRSTC
jgi:hypothetical protein